MWYFLFYLFGLLTIPLVWCYVMGWSLFRPTRQAGLRNIVVIGLWLLSPLWVLYGLITGDLEF